MLCPGRRRWGLGLAPHWRAHSDRLHPRALTLPQPSVARPPPCTLHLSSLRPNHWPTTGQPWMCAARAAPPRLQATVAMLLAANPKGPKATDGNGCLPLHLALRHRACVSTVETLLARFPAAAQARDGGGSLPLHLAAAVGAGHAVVSLLLDAFAGAAAEPEASHHALPLRVALASKVGQRREGRSVLGCTVGFQRLRRVTSTPGFCPLLPSARLASPPSPSYSSPPPSSLPSPSLASRPDRGRGHRRPARGASGRGARARPRLAAAAPRHGGAVGARSGPGSLARAPRRCRDARRGGAAAAGARMRTSGQSSPRAAESLCCCSALLLCAPAFLLRPIRALRSACLVAHARLPCCT